MAATEESDDNRLTGRMPMPPRRRSATDDAPPVDPAGAVDDDDPAEPSDDHEIDAVSRLMGFLRSTDDEV
jgi:hypothetical protein